MQLGSAAAVFRKDPGIAEEFMELGSQRSSENVEDRRGIGVGGGLGIGGVIIVLIAAFLGVDPSQILDFADRAAPQQERAGTPGASRPVQQDEMERFVSKVLASTEDAWQEIFRNAGKPYHDPKLVLFTGAVRSACGTGQSAIGPFYCPNDERVSLD